MFTVLTVSDLTEVLEACRSMIIDNNLQIFIKVASVLAALTAAWAYIKISHDYMEGQGVTFWMFVKPLLIVILVCEFNTFVLHPIHAVTHIFTEDLTIRTRECTNNWATSMTKLAEKVNESDFNPLLLNLAEESGQTDETPDSKSEDGFWSKAWSKIKKWSTGLWAGLMRVSVSNAFFRSVGFTTILYSVLLFIMNIVYNCQVCVCYILLIIYGLLGPFVFAISTIEHFSRGIGDWISRYIQTAFWIPVGQIIFFIGSVFMENINKIICQDVGHFDINANNGLIANYNIGSWLGAIMVIATMFCILQVPKICSYIIESAGSAGVGQGIGSQVKQAGMSMLGGKLGAS